MSTARIFLVEPHRLLREGIKVLLQETSFRVEGESSDWRDVIRALAQGDNVDLLLLELPVGSTCALSLLRKIHRAVPKLKIVLLTTSFEPSLLASASELGICGLLQKDISPMALRHSLELVMLGEKVFPIHETFLPMAVEPEAAAPAEDDAEAVEPSVEPSFELAGLSEREVEILRYLMTGLPNKLIARELKVAETTVKAHVKTILRKIKAGNRTQAAIWCLTNGLDSRTVKSDDRKREDAGNDLTEAPVNYRATTPPFLVKALRGSPTAANGSATIKPFVVPPLHNAEATADGTSL
jgi:two-component system, NarL family, nitrate/nitrite response regulator NarL